MVDTTTAPVARIVGWYDNGAAAIIEIVIADKATHQVLDPLGTPEVSGQSLTAARKAAVALWGEFMGAVYEDTVSDDLDIDSRQLKRLLRILHLKTTHRPRKRRKKRSDGFAGMNNGTRGSRYFWCGAWCGLSRTTQRP